MLVLLLLGLIVRILHSSLRMLLIRLFLLIAVATNSDSEIIRVLMSVSAFLLFLSRCLHRVKVSMGVFISSYHGLMLLLLLWQRLLLLLFL